MIVVVTDLGDGVTPEAVGVSIAVTEGSASGGGGAVDSVNGQTGVVVLDAADVGADASGTAAAAVTAHEGDVTDAHSIAGVTGLQAALDGKADDADITALDGRVDALEAVDNATQAELNTHAADTTSVHGIADTTALETSAGAQAKADAAQAAAEATASAALSAHTGDVTDAHDASAISVVPAGGIAATDVQAALAELDSEKAATSHTHTLDGLSDVDTTGVATDDVLTYDGSGWVAAAPSGGSTPGAWSAYTPALTAATTNPTLGTGGAVEASGRYEQIGKTVRFQVVIRFGTSGVSTGNGNYRISLPVPARATTLGGASALVIDGTGYVQDDSAGVFYHVVLEMLTTSTVQLIRDGSGAVSNTAPFAFGASDSFRISGTYEAA